MGLLAGSTSENSSYHYVEFESKASLMVPPQTGDSTRPWLWLGIALAAVPGVAGMLLIRRKRRAYGRLSIYRKKTRDTGTYPASCNVRRAHRLAVSGGIRMPSN